MLKLSHLLLFILCITLGEAQTPYRVIPFMNKVIAKSGLNLRSAPNTKSDVVQRLPFGALVDISQDDDYGYDTLEVIKTEVNTFNICGYWIKVSYKGKTGYINNAYLHLNDKKWPQDDAGLYNNSVVFLEYQKTCHTNSHPVHPYKWYGYYSDDCELRPIKIQYGRNISDMTDFYIIVKEDDGLDWIVGSKDPLPTGPVDYLVKDFTFSTSIPYDEKTETYSSYTEPNFEVLYTKLEKSVHSYDLKIKHGLESQLIMDAKYDGDLKGIRWMGDLDQDGRMDYILQYGEKDGRTLLYLSSKRISQRLILPVGCYYTGYCC